MDKEGDLNVSFPKAPVLVAPANGKGKQREDDFGDTVDEEVEMQAEDRHEAWRFLLAGGVAGAGTSTIHTLLGGEVLTMRVVSRSVTAPFDRLKVYLITTTTAPSSGPSNPSIIHPVGSVNRAFSNLWGAVVRIYGDGGGLRAFWVGNGLNVTKIFPVRAFPSQIVDTERPRNPQ